MVGRPLFLFIFNEEEKTKKTVVKLWITGSEVDKCICQ